MTQPVVLTSANSKVSVQVGAGSPVFIAGPCSVESYEQLALTAQTLKELGVDVLRGGTFKARTLHTSFQGLGKKALAILRDVAREYDMIAVSEITSEFDVELYNNHVDVFQIGARNAQNYRLLAEVGQTKKPVILKRGMGETLEELVASVAYLYTAQEREEGCNPRVILCERGIRTFEHAARATLDVCAVPVLKALSDCPVLVDPSHAAGQRNLVSPLASAGIAAGADGLIVEVHPNPPHALSDAAQQLDLEDFTLLHRTVGRIHQALVSEF